MMKLIWIGLAVLSVGALVAVILSSGDNSTSEFVPVEDRGAIEGTSTGDPIGPAPDRELGIHPEAPTVLPQRELLATVTDGPIVSYAVVANLAGEVEACGCEGDGKRGGLLANMAAVAALRESYSDVLPVDGGGNQVKVNGAGEVLLKREDLPALFLESVDQFVGERRLDRLRIIDPARGSLYLQSQLALEDRGTAILVVSLPAAEMRPNQPANLPDLTDMVQSSFGYVVDYIDVRGDIWRNRAPFQGLRDRLVGEWVDQFAPRPAGGEFAPIEDCASCHQENFRGWMTHKTHSAAWQTLVEIDYAIKNVFCVACHTTGVPLDVLKRSPFTIQRENFNVTCTSCHAVGAGAHGTGNDGCGAGAALPTRDTCSSCHTPGTTREDVIPQGVSLAELVGCTNH